MTLAERRAAVLAALEADPCRSDRLIAQEVGCGREMVGSIRRALCGHRSDRQAGWIDQPTGALNASQRASGRLRRGRDNKCYPVVSRTPTRKTRMQLTRARVIYLLQQFQDQVFLAEFARAAPEQQAGLGRLTLELAAAAARARAGRHPRQRGVAG